MQDATLPAPGSFCTRLGPEDWEFLTSSGILRTYRANEALFRQGDPAGYVLLIIDGWVKITIAARSGYEAILAIRGRGDVLGEISVLDGKPRSASVWTLGEVTAIAIRADRFVAALEARPAIAIELVVHVADRLRRADNRRLEQAVHSTTERLAAFLLRLADQHGRAVEGGLELSVNLSQQDIAGAIGASREAVARGLRILRDRAVVITRRRKLVIVALSVLSAMAANVQFDTDEMC